MGEYEPSVVIILDTSETMSDEDSDEDKGKKHGGKESWHPTKCLRETGFAEVAKAIAELELDSDATRQVQVVGRKKKTGAIGTDSAAESTIVRYEYLWKACRDYCFLTGDYVSAIILCRTQCPSDPFPVTLDTAANALRFFVQKKGIPLLHHRTNQPVLDLKKQPIQCVGVWKSKCTVILYRTALTKLHNHYPGTTGPYEDACREYKELGIDACKKGEACRRHCGKPRFSDTGNVGGSKAFVTKHQQMIKYAKDNYQHRNTVAFLPSELRLVSNYWMSANELYPLMLWTITMLGTKLFARVNDELLNMKVEDLDQNYFVMNPTDVIALCAQLEGKTDKELVHLAMWDDKECPEFSPTRILMIWIAISGIKSGYLFPSTDQLGKTDSPTKQLGYGAYLHHIKFASRVVLGKDPEDPEYASIIWGTHILRHTGYLLGSWSWLMEMKTKVDEVHISNMSQSARHADVKTMSTYLSDSGTLLNLVDKIGGNDPKNKVGAWDPIHIKTHSHFKTLNLKNKQYQKPIHKVADWYLYDLIGIPREQKNIAIIWQQVCAFKAKITGRQEVKEKIMAEGVSEEGAARIMAMMMEEQSDAVRQAMMSSVVAAATSSAVAAATEDSDVQPPPAKKMRFSFTRDFQQEAAKANDKAKQVNICVSQVAEWKEKTKDEDHKYTKDALTSMDAGKKRFLYRAASVAQCVDECFGGDHSAFLDASKFTISRFKCGKGETHKANLFENC